MGEADEARRRHHVVLSTLEAETGADPDAELRWSVPTARSDRAYNWGDSANAPDAVGHLVARVLHVPFYFEPVTPWESWPA